MLRAFACLVIGLAAAQGRKLQQELKEQAIYDSGIAESLPQTVDTVFALGGGQTGGVQITGMLQNFALDQDPINLLLNRPSTSYLDVSWSNWVDQRLELLDVFQELMGGPSRPRCPHMQSGAAMDNGMVSYLASSRFGPAIMTTYARQAEEDQADFDYDTVSIPAGQPLRRSYEDASLQEEMSADADKAFEMAALESRMLNQKPNLGYFGANTKKQILYGQLDGDSESVQPMILTHPNLIDLIERQQHGQLEPESFHKDMEEVEEAPVDAKQLALFVLLFVGCCYVWTCLIVSCMKLRRQACDRSLAGADVCLLVPFAPEGAESLDKVQVAADYAKPLTA